MKPSEAFWEDPERVEIFASRDPDKRLLQLLPSYQTPHQTRVLDLGCAGGRNTVILAEQGFEVYALDTSEAMVAKTRERVVPVLGHQGAADHIQVGNMQELQQFPAEFFHLIVALGVYHNATNRQDWEATLQETARVLRPDGRVLVANFSPRSDPNGTGLHPVAGENHVYEGFSAGPMYLLEADELDQAMARFGLLPVVPTETVTVPTDNGYRTTVNAFYRKLAP
ncbi:methyltransferase domain-containing protein [candidate division KSB3 bacterium]|uniref:Methyltransferase domain-containing protein n=1 Tax=candidate division KSB3 bacterium TaxID=2044937 RepID=A0A9D5Q556_9BACT|nr:methyltransferase domain-containing protein [candidate division KSB3 bacterium]MBD3324464.1 methyltransferase domain-containing protein [candidate division KSB3 bacterium]